MDIRSSLTSGWLAARARAQGRMSAATYRDPAAARAGGLVLIPAALVVASALVLHTLPGSRGFEESAGQLAETPLWALIHVAIAAGFVLITPTGLLLQRAGLDRFLRRLGPVAPP